MEESYCSTKGKKIKYTTEYANTSDLETESKEPLRRVCEERDFDCLGKRCPLNRLEY